MRINETIIRKLLKRPYRLARRHDNGTGQTVVFLHGIASSSVIWQPLFNMPHDGSRYVAFDLLGFGDSPKPDWLAYSVRDHAASVASSIKKLKHRDSVVLVGHSMGCLVATQVAYDYPKLVKRLILYQPPLLASQTGIKRYDNRTTMYLRAFGYIASKQELVLNYSRYIGQKRKRKGNFVLEDQDWLPFERSMRNTIMHQNTYDQLLAMKITADIIYGRKDRLVIRAAAQQLFADNSYIRLHTINEIHGLSLKSATYLAHVINN